MVECVDVLKGDRLARIAKCCLTTVVTQVLGLLETAGSFLPDLDLLT
jgi:hypothetical protein